jgi:hypothetical protein
LLSGCRGFLGIFGVIDGLPIIIVGDGPFSSVKTRGEELLFPFPVIDLAMYKGLLEIISSEG